jgi:hypothetical protein
VFLAIIYIAPACLASPGAGVFERRGRAMEGVLGLVGFEERGGSCVVMAVGGGGGASSRG